MRKCKACSHEVADGHRFCPVCAEPLGDDPTPALDDDATPIPTAATERLGPGLVDDPTPIAPATATPGSALDPDEPRFVPGTVLAGRYRIIGLLGRGGMGEVYRADDLKLGQSVALKFLPRGLDDDPERLQRFLGEVRVALRITHPNVCRVYDIGEVDGAHYLSMEYIDGEDLSSLLRRIGRLPEDKAVDIARQLCAGLAAAHEQGILHRDLKPANVMLDGRGDVRITDFGLAGLADGFTGLEIRAGTPAFMAPEQLAGKEVTTKSDIYSLGLVLYELFTGQRALRGDSTAEISRLQQSGLTSPSSHVSLLDPAVEQVILRCLAPEPADRPASVLKVALGLPGADPLAAALAAGETPSPEMVAEAGDDEGLAPRLAVPLMIFAILGLFTYSWLASNYHLLGRVPMELPPQALVYRAQEILKTLGHEKPAADQAYEFRTDQAYLKHLAEDSAPNRWHRLRDARPAGIYFWYRQSPRPLMPQNVGGRVTPNDPPLRLSGMVDLSLDSQGRLLFLRAAPPQHEPSDPRSDGAAAGFPWPALFDAAGLLLDDFTPCEPEWVPETFCNQRVAWTGSYRDQPDPQVRVEACAYNDQLVYFLTVHPWDRPVRQQQVVQSTGQQLKLGLVGAVFVSILLGALMLTRRNLRLGRGDRRGALRLTAWTTITGLAGWFFQASHVPNFGEIVMFFFGFGNILFLGAIVGVLYIALEPFVRRRWPESLVSWNRLLAGRLRDPLVGRHMLYGAALGVCVMLLNELGMLAPTFFGKAGPTPPGSDFDSLLGPRWILGDLLFSLRQAVVLPMTLLFMLVLLRVVLRKSSLAAVAFVAIFTLLGANDSQMVIFGLLASIAIWALFGWCMMRFGLVALMSAWLVNSLSGQLIALDLNTWYAGNTFAILAAIVTFIVSAFRISLAGQPLFSED